VKKDIAGFKGTTKNSYNKNGFKTIILLGLASIPLFNFCVYADFINAALNMGTDKV